MESSESVLPIFILDLDSQEKFWKDDIRFAFLREALTHLSGQRESDTSMHPEAMHLMEFIEMIKLAERLEDSM